MFTAEGDPIQVRQFPKRAGYPEDPATGAAASAIGAYLSLYSKGQRQEGWESRTICQGFAMGRPSELIAKVLWKEGRIAGMAVSGSAML